MSEIVFLGERENSIDKVFSLGRKERITAFGECAPEIVGHHNLDQWKMQLSGVKYAFSTWGIPNFTQEEYNEYFPSLKYIFYAAGTVKKFAQNAFGHGIRIFSSRLSNAIPVAETVFAQIILANKGFYRSSMKASYKTKKKISENYSGNYEATVGIIGVGTIGTLLAERLKSLSVRVIVWDKFLTDERAKELGVKKVSLETLFTESDVISNHLADKQETEGILNYALFSKMKKYATFINSGRGRQVVEKDLVRALKKERGRTAVLDVTFPEPPAMFSPVMHTKNLIVTPHIDGSSGQEVVRMADEMIDSYLKIIDGQAVRNEIFLCDLATMA